MATPCHGTDDGYDDDNEGADKHATQYNLLYISWKEDESCHVTMFALRNTMGGNHSVFHPDDLK